MRRKVENMNPNHVLTLHAKHTRETKGMQTVHVCRSTSETKRATLTATVTMSDELLLPFLILKGMQNRRIAKTELATFLDMGFCAMQSKAWMDKSMISMWIEKCQRHASSSGVTPSHFGSVLCPHYGNSSVKNPGYWIKSPLHPWWLHLSVPTN